VHRAHVGDLQQSLLLRVVEVAPMVISRVISSSRPSFVSQCPTDHIKPTQHRREPMSLEPNALSLKRAGSASVEHPGPGSSSRESRTE
jgi:hypothetical protein